MAKLGVLELRKPWTDCHKLWHGWLRRQYDPVRQNSDRPSRGVPANGWNITLVWFFVCDLNFCSRPETKPENRFLWCLINRISIPGYCIRRGIKLLRKVSYFLNFYPKTLLKWAWIGNFNAQNIKTCILSKLLHRFKPNFAYWQRWSKQAYNKSKMADGRHLEKSKTAISLKSLNRSAQNLARWRILTFRRICAVKICNF